MAIQVGRVLTSLALVAGVSYSCAAPRHGSATPATHQVAAASAPAVVRPAHRG